MMKNLKTYRMFERSVALTPEQVEWLDECTSGTWQLNPQTGLVDVDGDFNCHDQGLSDFKGVLFGKVGGQFDCSYNRLSSLEGAPEKVKWHFYCSDNRLTSLEGAPQNVGGNFACGNNQLTTLEGAPREIGENFYCNYNQLTSLEGAPQKVGKRFYCRNNQLTSLEGAPQEVRWGLYCENNPVSEKTLESIFGLMKKGESYLKAVESIWTEIPVEDQILLYRPEFEWIVGDERKKLDALRAYQGFKGMI